MIDEDGQGPKQMSPQLERFLTFARFMFVPASGLAALGIVSCLAVGCLGKFWCTLPLDSIIANGSGDFFGFAILEAFSLAVVRGLGGNTPEMIDKMAAAFDDYSEPGVYMFSTLISSAHFVSLVVLLGAFASLFIPIGIVIYELKAVWSACVMAASGSA